MEIENTIKRQANQNHMRTLGLEKILIITNYHS